MTEKREISVQRAQEQKKTTRDTRSKAQRGQELPKDAS